MSASLETAVDSFKKNGVGLKGIISTPSQMKGGILQTLNMKIRSVAIKRTEAQHENKVSRNKT